MNRDELVAHVAVGEIVSDADLSGQDLSGVELSGAILEKANFGGANHPAWSYNLQANPDAEIEIGGRRKPVRARVVDGDERAELWRRVNEMYEGFDEYDAKTSRDIAVFTLEPR